MKKLYSFSRSLLLTLLAGLIYTTAFCGNYYVVDSNPWGTTNDITAMNNVFGAGNWTQGNFSTPAATIFSPSNNVVFLEGSDWNPNFPTFVSTNIALIENWVNNGGRLFMNAGPNYGSNQNWGFNNTVLNYAWYANSVTTTVPANQIFTTPYTPTATTYGGSSFAHAYISGTGLTSLLYDVAYAANTHPVLCYKQWGAGIVFFGGCTQPNYWWPTSPEAFNLWYNILYYVKTFPLTGITPSVTGSPWCAGASITVNYSSIGLTFTAGNVFTVQLSNATGSFASPTNIGTLTSTATSGSIICTIPAAQAGGTGYRIRILSSVPAFTGADNGTDLVINPQLVPAVTITANPGNTICAGTNVTFTAAVTNGGPSPTYQWYVNASPVGGNTPTYSTTTLANGQVVTCTITSNASCATPPTATSNSITMIVNPNVTPTVTVTANPGNTICLGQSVTFTSSISNGGPTPTYIWKVNGFPVGTAASYTTSTLNNNDVVTCQLTSNAPCVLTPVVTSTPITMTVTPTVLPTINITANPGNTACAGANVTFTANITNGGPTPAYQWYVNGNPVGTGSTYSTSVLNTNDIVSCTLTSSAPCATPATVSGSMTMTIVPNVTPTINVTANPGTTICSGTSVTFTANTSNAGPAPTYQWYNNGNPVGNNSATYTTTALANGDNITCVMTSSAQCASPQSVTAGVVMTVNQTVAPTITLTASPGNSVCTGTNVTFSASITNGGPTPVYTWYINGNPVGSGPVYAYNNFANGDMVTCQLNSNAVCASPAVVTSATTTMNVYNSVTPTVSIANNTGNTICAGTSVTFTATPANGGPVPSYQWYRNGNPVGTNSATFIDNTLANGDVITCDMTSNASCASPTLVTSNSVAMTVIPTVTPVATITATPGNSICAGTQVTFNATVTNGGPAPVYAWKKNGNPVGGNSATYADNNLNNTDVITCMLTSNATCAAPATVYSNNITMNVTSTVIPATSISVSPGNAICSGTQVTFTATSLNTGPSPLYQWYVNGIPAGPNAASYTTATLNTNDVVTCDMTSNASCATPATVTSNGITMTVQGVTVPGVTISTNSPLSICQGSPVTFTAAPVNGGPSPIYHWIKNGLPVGTFADTYNDNNLADNDMISCVMVSSDLCPSQLTDTSNTITMTVDQYVTPAVFINGVPDICTGNPLTLTAIAYNPGPNPSYKWMLNGVQNGTGPTWTGTNLNDGDIVYCILSSTAPCLLQNADSSDVDTVHWFNAGYLAGVPGGTETNTVPMINAPSVISYNDCDLISTVIPSGQNPVSGNLTAGVTIDADINNYNGQYYVQRHYDIQPSSNPSSATAIVKLYAYQSEFDAYDSLLLHTGSLLPPLPSNHIDNGHVRVTQFHGTGTAPGNYTGTEELIFPTVNYDTSANWWVITFPVHGFGGFYIHTSDVVFPLSVTGIVNDGFSIEAYPNPAREKVEVRIHGLRSGNSLLTITDIAGRKLITSSIEDDKATIDMSGFASGVYMLHYKDDARTETLKVIKQ